MSPYGDFSLKDFFRDSKTIDRLFFIASCAISFGVYLRTLCPTVFVGDSGELISAAYTLRIPHPPGYPTFCLLGKLFTLLPVGNVAYRVNLLSAFFASLTIGFVYRILLHLFRRETQGKEANAFALAGAFLFAFLRDFWFYALSAEVYTLNTFFFAVLLYVLLRWQEEKKETLFFLGLFLFGLGLGNHHTLLMFGPLALCVLLLEAPEMVRNPRFLGKSLIFIGLGLSVYLYLPLRAANAPTMNWGVTPSWRSVLNHILRTRYHDIGLPPYRLDLYLQQLHSFFQTLGRQAPLFFWIFSILGFWKLLSKHPAFFFISAFLFLGGSFLLILTAPFEATSMNIYLMRPFYLPAWMILVLFWGIGLREGVSFFWKGSALGKRWRVWALVFLFPLFLLVAHFPFNDLSDHRLAEAYGRDLLDTVPSNGILFASGDNTLFILSYLTHVEKLRPDILITGLETSSFPQVQKKSFFKFLSQSKKISVYTNAPHLSYPAGFELKPRGLLYQLVRKGEAVPKISWKTYPKRLLAEDIRVKDLLEKHLVSYYVWAKTEALLAVGDSEKAHLLLKAFSAWAEKESFLQLRLGMFCLSKGWPSEGMAALQRAFESNPYDSGVWKGLGIALGQLGYYHDSVRFLLQAFERQPRDANITFNLGTSYGNLRRFEEALFWWRKTLLLDPRHRLVHEYMRKTEAPSHKEKT